ncbi:MAG: ABC transporter ATP-binding protein, partial [Candidatus Cloacimonetes bacterium]|nr:ABC transporter ATP-binding protein [Candidatus Cloacimonadota bacterium]
MLVRESSDKYAVITENLTRNFGSFKAVNEVSISVERGEIFGFLGANGAGKTTMIRMLCGLLQPSSGTGQVAGHDLYTESEKIKENIGYMSQKFSLYNDLKVLENISFYGGIYGLSGRQMQMRSKELLNLTGIESIGDKPVADLPLGYKQRLALICAVLHNPDIIFLDEPT